LDNAGFLGYKVNISFVAEKITYAQICGIKVGPSLKNGAIAKKSVIGNWVHLDRADLPSSPKGQTENSATDV